MDSCNKIQSKPAENEKFWRQHYELQQLSGLSRVNYCRQNDLNYDRFGYWISKWNHQNKLISVKIKPTPEEAAQKILCSLELKNGYCLKIHDLKALGVILGQYT